MSNKRAFYELQNADSEWSIKTLKKYLDPPEENYFRHVDYSMNVEADFLLTSIRRGLCGRKDPKIIQSLYDRDVKRVKASFESNPLSPAFHADANAIPQQFNMLHEYLKNIKKHKGDEYQIWAQQKCYELVSQDFLPGELEFCLILNSNIPSEINKLLDNIGIQFSRQAVMGQKLDYIYSQLLCKVADDSI